jgi:hypothetical protein
MRVYPAVDFADNRTQQRHGADRRSGGERNIFVDHQPLHLGEGVCVK